MDHHQFSHQANHHYHHQVLEPISPSRSYQMGSPSSPPTSTTNSPAIPTTTLINAAHYQMLMTGDPRPLGRVIIDQNLNIFDLVTEFEDSSVLHVAATAGQDDMIDFIVSQFSRDDNEHGRPHPLLRPNSNGDLAIHVAARAGKSRAVERLIARAASIDAVVDQQNSSATMCLQMLEAVNNEGNTALHIALENQQKDMANNLFTKCPDTFYRRNHQGHSPIYLAIKAGDSGLVQKMLDVKGQSGDEKQLEMAKVVHAAIMAKDLGTLKNILKKYEDLNKSSDERKRRPLSYAAYTGFLEGVDYLLHEFQNLAFRPDDDGSFPIHRACSGGDIRVVKAFVNHSPALMWSLNKEGQNILHVAAESGKAKVVNHILGLPNSESLINMKDEDGNTPLHLASRAKHPKVVYALTWDNRVKLNLQNKKNLTALDIAEDYGQVPCFEERLTWLALRYANVPRAPKIYLTAVAMNDPNGSIIDVPSGVDNEYVQNVYTEQMSPTNKYKERLNTLLMVSTLVATVTFASGFTVPGGYNQDQDKKDVGMATLAAKCAFQVFVISNTIALFSSILAMVTLIWAHLDDLRLILLSLDFALPLLGTALAMMSVAFMAGLYVTLHNKLWLGIVVLVLGGSFLGAVLVFFIPLYSPTSRIKYKLLRYFFHFPFMLMLLACEKGKSETLY